MVVRVVSQRMKHLDILCCLFLSGMKREYSGSNRSHFSHTFPSTQSARHDQIVYVRLLLFRDNLSFRWWFQWYVVLDIHHLLIALFSYSSGDWIFGSAVTRAGSMPWSASGRSACLYIAPKNDQQKTREDQDDSDY